MSRNVPAPGSYGESDEALVVRMNAAPDMGGATLVELSRLIAMRAARTKG